MNKKIFIVGAGFMGTGIAQNAAVCGMTAAVYDVSEVQLEKSRAALTREIMKLIGMDAMYENCSIDNCSCRNSHDPLICSLLSVLGELPTRDIAKIYAYALELRDVPFHYRYPSTTAPAPIPAAAEEQAPFN